MRYQSEIHVAQDRYVCVQLPSYFPEGRAVVVVLASEDDPVISSPTVGDDQDRQDIEWWDEFEENEIGRRP